MNINNEKSTSKGGSDTNITKESRDEEGHTSSSKSYDPISEDEDVIDRVIRHVGEMGTYQKILVAFMMPFGSVMVYVYSIQMFITATPEDHWCRVPELQSLPIDERRNLSIPGAAEGKHWDRCHVYVANWKKVIDEKKPPPENTPIVPCQHGWEYLYNDIPFSTVTSEREWICNRAKYQPIAQFMFFFGSLVGCLTFGWIGDSYGRIPAFLGANAIGFVGSMSTLLTRAVWDFALARFVTGMCNDTIFFMIYILILEYIGPQHRTWVTNLSYGLFVAGAQLTIPALALTLLDWRKLLIVTAMPILLSLPAYWIVPESARWLASQGKTEKALKIFAKFERINKTKIPENVLTEFRETKPKKQNTMLSVKEAFHSVYLRNATITVIACTIMSQLSFDAVIRLTEKVGYSFFIAFAASAIAEIPAMVVVTFTIDRFGRRPVIIVTFIMSAIFAFITGFTSGGLVQMILIVTTRFFVNMGIITLVQVAPEVLPTPIRATGTSFIHVTVYAFVMISPFIVFSGRIWKPLPCVIVGCMCICGACLSFLLPETVGKPMPQTIPEGEHMVKTSLLYSKRGGAASATKLDGMLFNKIKKVMAKKRINEQ